MSTIAIIFWIIIALIAYAFREELMAIAAFVGICMGIGALVFWLAFDKASLGASVGFGFAVLFGLRLILQAMGARYANVFEYAYRIISFPFWLLNRIQLILMEPWRYWTKHAVSYSTREAVRNWLYPIEIILYILITPLRFINAVYYNIFVYSITELYDLTLEVIQPSDYHEGKGDFIGWLLWFPVRLVKYPIINGAMVLIEGAIWTIIDIFIPTITMYHGTDLTAAQAITGNDALKKRTKRWTDGTFCSSINGWAGAGAYFGSSRRTAAGYAYDNHRLSDNNPVMIVCRVSLGKILNYRLAPSYIHDNTGPDGNHAVINIYAESNGYTTGEWWNYNHNYWEYCMFDWRNRYNHPWRIRPIYVFNLRTGLAQHIDKGLRHWLFSKAVIDDILKSTKFMCLVIIAFIIVIWCSYHLITSNYHQNINTFFVSEPQQTEEDYSDMIPNDNIDNYVEPEEETTVQEPTMKEQPKNDYRPVTQSPPRQAQKYQSSTTNSQPKRSGTGFKLEKVDHIPTANTQKKGNGFKLERVDNIPTNESTY